ncbi:MAG: hypothetical protein M1837_003648 [Sclerophora amabilis]|nr:MAG: hypothetical protein M1837_003648 [Sclerophora amabilis]
MCIALITTAHPQYPFILIDNRDEYLDRPTAPADFWPPPNGHVLGGHDLLKAERGTWLGITRQGRVAVLTNFREESPGELDEAPRSRGAMVNAWLQQPPSSGQSAEQFVESLFSEEASIKGVGGFSLVCGQLTKAENHSVAPLAVVSNRTPDATAATWIAGTPGETHGLSNSAYDNPWTKVRVGETLLKDAIEESITVGEGKRGLIRRLFGVLSVDTLPKRREGEHLETYLEQLRYSIFVPPIGADTPNTKPAAEIRAAAPNSDKVEVVGNNLEPGVMADSLPVYVYGTQKQTIILLDRFGQVTFVERTLFDERQRPIQIGDGDRTFEFEVEGWA